MKRENILLQEKRGLGGDVIDVAGHVMTKPLLGSSFAMSVIGSIEMERIRGFGKIEKLVMGEASGPVDQRVH